MTFRIKLTKQTVRVALFPLLLAASIASMPLWPYNRTASWSYCVVFGILCLLTLARIIAAGRGD